MATGKLSEDMEVSDIELDEAVWTATAGDQGEELSVELLMRVVADIGLVGLPNAGKSSILKAVTRASPAGYVSSISFTPPRVRTNNATRLVCFLSRSLTG